MPPGVRKRARRPRRTGRDDRDVDGSRREVGRSQALLGGTLSRLARAIGTIELDVDPAAVTRAPLVQTTGEFGAFGAVRTKRRTKAVHQPSDTVGTPGKNRTCDLRFRKRARDSAGGGTAGTGAATGGVDDGTANGGSARSDTNDARGRTLPQPRPNGEVRHMPVDVQRLRPPAEVVAPEKILALLDRSDSETVKAVVRWLVGEDARAATIVRAVIA